MRFEKKKHGGYSGLETNAFLNIELKGVILRFGGGK